jgi:hypothetical protein
MGSSFGSMSASSCVFSVVEATNRSSLTVRPITQPVAGAPSRPYSTVIQPLGDVMCVVRACAGPDVDALVDARPSGDLLRNEQDGGCLINGLEGVHIERVGVTDHAVRRTDGLDLGSGPLLHVPGGRVGGGNLQELLVDACRPVLILDEGETEVGLQRVLMGVDPDRPRQSVPIWLVSRRVPSRRRCFAARVGDPCLERWLSRSPGRGGPGR